MSENLGTEEVANGVDQITSDTPTKEGKPRTMPGLQDHKLDQPPKQGAVLQASTLDRLQLNRSSTAES